MGWASEALERDLSKAGIFPMRDNGSSSYRSGSGNNYKFDSDKFIEDMEDENNDPFPEEKQVKKEENGVKIEAIKVMDSNSETSRGVFNVTIGGIIKINYVRLYVNRNTGEYFTLMPSFKNSLGKYNRYIEIDESLNRSIIKACLSDINKEKVYYGGIK